LAGVPSLGSPNKVLQVSLTPSQTSAPGQLLAVGWNLPGAKRDWADGKKLRAWKMRVSFLRIDFRFFVGFGRSTIVLGNFNWFQGFCWKLKKT